MNGETLPGRGPNMEQARLIEEAPFQKLRATGKVFKLAGIIEKILLHLDMYREVFNCAWTFPKP